MISAAQLTKRFGNKIVLRNLDLQIEAGEFVAMLGPNGAGKSTLLRILASLSSPTFGRLEIAGCRLPHQAAAVRRRLGVVLHQPLLYGDLSAAENLQFFGRMYALPALDQSVAAALELVGLAARRDDLVRTFSRGMQQRLSIARAILHDPDVLLLDEPYTGLDQDAADILDGLLRRVAATGRTILMTSHDLIRIAGLATRFDVLSRGRIAASARREDPSARDLLGFYREALQHGR